MTAAPRVLVAYSSRHEATAEIARCLADAVRSGSGDTAVVDVRDVVDVPDVAGWDAVVLGSAVYAGRWTREARDAVERCAVELGRRPVWLFSSGPVGDPPRPDADLVDVDEELALTKAREHRVFTGLLDRDRLSAVERLVTRLFRAGTGDGRDWPAIRAWGTAIGVELTAGATTR
ncbi:flavodoxin [Geodermatophilaceae bacterium NBWT11]|nr:flavodoxin [Geodermatophilaceae bacterium NBWT11]